MNYAILAVIIGAANLMGLWWLIYFGFRSLGLNQTRHDLFQIRDDLFFAAAEGKISFDSAAYTLLRERLNHSIRFAHKFELTRLLMFSVFTGKIDASSPQDQWKLAFRELSEEQKSVIELISERYYKVLVCHIIEKSFIFKIFAIPLLAKTIFVRPKQRTLMRVQRTLHRPDFDRFIASDARLSNATA
jgi:hypothetical protein